MVVMSPVLDAPGSVLVYVGLDPVGDGLIRLPFVRALRNAFPSAEITWLAGRGRSVYAHALAPLVEDLIDEVLEEASGRPADTSPPLVRRRRVLRAQDHGGTEMACIPQEAVEDAVNALLDEADDRRATPRPAAWESRLSAGVSR